MFAHQVTPKIEKTARYDPKDVLNRSFFNMSYRRRLTRRINLEPEAGGGRTIFAGVKKLHRGTDRRTGRIRAALQEHLSRELRYS